MNSINKIYKYNINTIFKIHDRIKHEVSFHHMNGNALTGHRSLKFYTDQEQNSAPHTSRQHGGGATIKDEPLKTPQQNCTEGFELNHQAGFGQ